MNGSVLGSIASHRGLSLGVFAAAISLSALATALQARGMRSRPATARLASAVLPSPSPLFATRAATGTAAPRAIGFLIGVGGLQRLGVGTTVSLRCVTRCQGARRVRIGAARSQLQLRFEPPLRLSRGAVIELRATRLGSTGRWQRYRMVKRPQGVFAALNGRGCLSERGRVRCPVPKSPDPHGALQPAPVTVVTPAPVVTPIPDPSPTVAFVSPDDRSTVAGVVRLVANASAASGVEWQGYYATNRSDPATLAWRVIGRDTTPADGLNLDWDTRKIQNQGDGARGTVNVVAIALDSSGAPTAARDYRRVNIVNYDFTRDGYLGCADIQTVLDQWNTAGTADVNGDGVVNISDLSIMLANFYPPPGESQPCP